MAKAKANKIDLGALTDLEREKGIDRDQMITAMEKAMVSSCEVDYGKDCKAEAHINHETGVIKLTVQKAVVEKVMNPKTEISVENARHININAEAGDTVTVDVDPAHFGRVAAQRGKSIIQQSIKEFERAAQYTYFHAKEHDIVTGIVERYSGDNLVVNLDAKAETMLPRKEIIPGEHYGPNDRIKLYIVEVHEGRKRAEGKGTGDCRIVVSRTHPDLVKRLFEREVAEIEEGIVEIKSISREAGSRSKIAVYSNDENVDAVGACVGQNGSRVNAIVTELHGEKMDIIQWDENPAVFIENALRPAKVVSVRMNEDGTEARVVVPDYQLSLAIGKEGQNARLAARLTGFKIDIKSESQQAALDNGDFEDEGLVDDLDDAALDIEEDDAE